MSEKVSAIRFNSDEAEGLLRDALSQVCEIRSRGKTPFLVVMLGDDENLPSFGRTEMFTTDMLACSARAALEADTMMREVYTERGDDE